MNAPPFELSPDAEASILAECFGLLLAAIRRGRAMRQIKTRPGVTVLQANTPSRADSTSAVKPKRGKCMPQ